MTLTTVSEPPQKLSFLNGVNLYEYCHCCSLPEAQFATVAQSQTKKKGKEHVNVYHVMNSPIT